MGVRRGFWDGGGGMEHKMRFKLWEAPPEGARCEVHVLGSGQGARAEAEGLG